MDWDQVDLEDDEPAPKQEDITCLQAMIKGNGNPHLSCFYGEVSATWRNGSKVVFLKCKNGSAICVTGDTSLPFGNFRQQEVFSRDEIEQVLLSLKALPASAEQPPPSSSAPAEQKGTE